MKKVLFLFVLPLTLFASTSLKHFSEENLLKSAHKYLQQEQYDKAILRYENILVNFPGSKNINEINFILSNIYFTKGLYEKSYSMTLKLYESGFKKDVNTFNLALFYYNGLGVKQDFKKAFSIFEKVPLNNTSDVNAYYSAQYFIGHMYFHGLGVKQDFKKAMDAFLKVKKNSQAFVKIGDLYLNGLGVKKDSRVAFYYYQKAANLGNIDALFRVGLLYYRGSGVGKNIDKSIIYFTKAATNKHFLAQFYLADLYYKGVEVNEDKQVAFKWMKEAAMNQHPKAQLALALMYMDGLGTKIDEKKAAFWMNLSYKNGYAPAKQFLDKYNIYWNITKQ